MKGGFCGKILWVDLTDGTISVKYPDISVYRQYLGGYGLGDRILFSKLKPVIDPLGPDNILGFLPGILTGSGALVASRHMVVGKSPLTGTIGDANCGGFMGTEIKKAGYDGVFFTGRAKDPVYLYINDDRVEIRDASFCWGLDTYETEDKLRDATQAKARVSCIGPGGEKLSLLAGIVTEKGNVAARSGLGAVMGSKNLKALVVCGSKTIPVADPEMLKGLRKKYMPVCTDKDGMGGLMNDLGTAAFYEGAVESADAPIKNWSGAPEDLPDYARSGANALKEMAVKGVGCGGCPIACGKLVKPYHSPVPVRTVQYESIGAFGSMCLVDDIQHITKANDLCNRYGLDTISVGAACAYAMECYENGLLDDEQTGGLKLNWGDGAVMAALVEKICKREGYLGDLLADGVYRATLAISGSFEYGMQIGGQELPMHDQRLTPDLLTMYYAEATPGRHTQGTSAYAPPDMPLPENTGAAHKMMEDFAHVVDSCGFCLFPNIFMLSYKSCEEFLTAVTGEEFDLEEILRIGNRISMIRHAFNAREGSNFSERPVPERLLGGLTAGPLAGLKIDKEQLIKAYLEASGLDPVTCKPKKESLLDAGLDDVAAQLYMV
ncbi:MAG: aldehyde ferredoxin oxidoreductase family protein [Clostridiales bacterium]|nr:aldehyde ferredoxin oxidoreductase family protein [Clostridiales bacterium]